jgi:hypothetical protein
MTALIQEIRAEFDDKQIEQDEVIDTLDRSIQQIRDSIYSGYGPGMVISSANIANILQSTNFQTGSAGWRIEKDGDIEINNLTARGSMQSDNFVSGVSGWRIDEEGDAEFHDVFVRGKISASVFEKGIESAQAGVINLMPGATLITATGSPIAAGSNTFTVEEDVFNTGDKFFIQDPVTLDKSWFSATGGSGTTLIADYESGDTGWTPTVGDIVINYGSSGSSDRGILQLVGGRGSLPGPSLRVITHADAPWTTTTERLRVGYMDSWGPVTGDEFGIGIGDYAGNAYLYYTPTDGLVSRGKFDLEDGVIQGVLTLGTNGGLYQGTGTFASPTTGLKIFNDGGVGKLETYNAGSAQVTIDTDGELKAGGGDIRLYDDGLAFFNAATDNSPTQIKWHNGATTSSLKAFYLTGYLNATNVATGAMVTAGTGAATSWKTIISNGSGSGFGTTGRIELNGNQTWADATWETGNLHLHFYYHPVSTPNQGAFNITKASVSINESSSTTIGSAALHVKNDGTVDGNALFEDLVVVGKTNITLDDDEVLHADGNVYTSGDIRMVSTKTFDLGNTYPSGAFAGGLWITADSVNEASLNLYTDDWGKSSVIVAGGYRAASGGGAITTSGHIKTHTSTGYAQMWHFDTNAGQCTLYQASAVATAQDQNITWHRRFNINTNAVVLNEDGHDYDLRVEGDTDTALFTVIASTDRVGISTSSPDTLFQVDTTAASEGAHIGLAFTGNWSNTLYAVWGSKDMLDSSGNNYALLQHNTNGNTFLNASSTGGFICIGS